MNTSPKKRYRLAEGSSYRQMVLRIDQTLYDQIYEKAAQEHVTLTRAAAELMESALKNNCTEKIHDGSK